MFSSVASASSERNESSPKLTRQMWAKIPNSPGTVTADEKKTGSGTPAADESTG
jgi:hypothetical protein